MSSTPVAGPRSRLFPSLLSSLDPGRDAVGFIGPNWFASVMGTGIVANAAATLPLVSRQLHPFAIGVWVVAASLLIVAHHRGDDALGPSLPRPPVVTPRTRRWRSSSAAPPMALMTVGTGTLLLGSSVIGQHAAVDADWVLWSLGTITGLITAVTIPFLLFTQHEVRPDAAFGGWLMPVVPPMVSAANGALLISHLSSTSGRATLLYTAVTRCSGSA